MNRRELLAAVGVGATGIAGFVGGRGASARQGTRTTTPSTTTESDGFTGIDSSAERPFAAISVGSREGVRNPENNKAHAVRVWNDSNSARTIGLLLSRGDWGDAESPLIDRQIEFPADGYLTLRLLEPASYALAVSSGGGTSEPVQIPRAQFDCNDSQTDVAVTEDGQVESVTTTTEIGCPPEVTDRTFTALAGSCGSESEASVSFAEESVGVSGAIRAPNPCYGAELAEVAVSSADTLRVVVGTTEPTASVCAQCIANVRYEADLQFRDRVPGTVEVVHARGDQTETVATVTRDGATTGRGTTESGTTGQRDTTTE
ncbi:hypothetical protein [Halorussus ruber]|uniref:hypothetical protein n=1 Tax=Halorussus ruber TaxID=1126238 RepID=UPI001091D424|nr:hypothetical protein [Halorussus ruber]